MLASAAKFGLDFLLELHQLERIILLIRNGSRQKRQALQRARAELDPLWQLLAGEAVLCLGVVRRIRCNVVNGVMRILKNISEPLDQIRVKLLPTDVATTLQLNTTSSE